MQIFTLIGTGGACMDDWSNVKVLANPRDYRTRLVQEAFLIRAIDGTVNTDGETLPVHYENLVSRSSSRLVSLFVVTSPPLHPLFTPSAPQSVSVVSRHPASLASPHSPFSHLAFTSSHVRSCYCHIALKKAAA